MRSKLFGHVIEFAVAVLVIAITTAPNVAESGTANSEDELQLYRQSASHMGTQWHIALYSRSPSAANTAFAAAWDEIAAVDRDLSNYSVDSELNELCRSSPHENPIPVGEHLWTVLHTANALSRESNGAFDVTIGPVSKLWRRARRQKKMPAAEDLQKARQPVGHQLIEFGNAKRRNVRLTKGDMKIDLGGIAKGYAVDVAMLRLKELGIESALVNGGGDLAVMGTTPEHDGWELEVANLDPRRAAKRLVLKDAAIATSGDAWQYVAIDGKRYSHIIDPKTGLGTTNRKSVSVVARDCMTADSLASALCVLQVCRGLELARSHNAEARYIFAVEEGNATKLVSTANFPALHSTK